VIKLRDQRISVRRDELGLLGCDECHDLRTIAYELRICRRKPTRNLVEQCRVFQQPSSDTAVCACRAIPDL
jgi:hypothetical protein